MKLSGKSDLNVRLYNLFVEVAVVIVVGLAEASLCVSSSVG